MRIFADTGDDIYTTKILKEVRLFDSGAAYNRTKKRAGDDVEEVEQNVAGDDGGNEGDLEAEYSIEDNSRKRRTTRSRLLATTDRGLLWYISTEGCRRKVVRTYFDDTDISPFLTESPGELECCDNCLKGKGSSQKMLDLLPAEIASRTVTLPAPTPLQPLPVSTAKRQMLHQELIDFRVDIWNREGLNRPNGCYGPTIFYSTNVITRIVSKCGRINDVDSLAACFSKERFDLQFSSIGPYCAEMVELIRRIVSSPDPDPPLALPSSPRIAPTPSSMVPGARDFEPRRSSKGGRPKKALTDEKIKMEAAILAAAQIRMDIAKVANADGSEWDIALLS